MAARIYTDRDANLKHLRGLTLAVIGYGAQGHAHALNLRDSGLTVLIGLPPKSKSRTLARGAGFELVTAAEATRRGDVIFLALPDTKIPPIYEREIAPKLSPGKTLLFAHGFAILYRTIVPPKNAAVVMVAPKGLGPMVRREFVDGRGVPGLIAVHQDSRNAVAKRRSPGRRGLAARARGCWKQPFATKLKRISSVSKRSFAAE